VDLLDSGLSRKMMFWGVKDSPVEGAVLPPRTGRSRSLEAKYSPLPPPLQGGLVYKIGYIFGYLKT